MAQRFEPSKSPAPLPLASIDEPDIRILVASAGIVAAVDTATLDQHVFYGADMIAETARAMAEGRKVVGKQGVIRFALSFSTDEPERLARAIAEIKGSCSFRRSVA